MEYLKLKQNRLTQEQHQHILVLCLLKTQLLPFDIPGNLFNSFFFFLHGWHHNTVCFRISFSFYTFFSVTQYPVFFFFFRSAGWYALFSQLCSNQMRSFFPTFVSLGSWERYPWVTDIISCTLWKVLWRALLALIWVCACKLLCCHTRPFTEMSPKSFNKEKEKAFTVCKQCVNSYQKCIQIQQTEVNVEGKWIFFELLHLSVFRSAYSSDINPRGY